VWFFTMHRQSWMERGYVFTSTINGGDQEPISSQRCHFSDACPACPLDNGGRES